MALKRMSEMQAPCLSWRNPSGSDVSVAAISQPTEKRSRDVDMKRLAPVRASVESGIRVEHDGGSRAVVGELCV